jgi:hypothetical protein
MTPEDDAQITGSEDQTQSGDPGVDASQAAALLQNAVSASSATATDAAPAAAPKSGEKTITLSDGRVAVIRPGKGKDLLNAARASGGDQFKVMFAIVAALTTINGNALPMEDYLEMDLPDVMALQAEVGGGFLS